MNNELEVTPSAKIETTECHNLYRFVFLIRDFSGIAIKKVRFIYKLEVDLK